jgi:hypothetical protein
MKGNHKLGIALSIVGVLAGLLAFFLFASIYNPNIEGKILGARPDEALTVRIVFAMLGWLAIAAGGIWGAVLYGFANRQPWAWFWGALAATLQLLAGFFPMIPAASIGLPTPTISLFLVAILLWFGMLLIGGVWKKIILLTFVAGLAYVLTYMDGVASISKFQTNHTSFLNGLYMMAQEVNWWGAAGWAVFLLAVLKKKTWAIPVGIFAACLSMMGGFPLGIINAFEVKRFSMFLPAPLMSTALLITLLLPRTRRLLEKWYSG